MRGGSRAQVFDSLSSMANIAGYKRAPTAPYFAHPRWRMMCSSLHRASTSASTLEFISVLRASSQRFVGFEFQSLHKVTTMACRAVIEAASRFNRFFSGQMTAAGRVPPAKVHLQPGLPIFHSCPN